MVEHYVPPTTEELFALLETLDAGILEIDRRGDFPKFSVTVREQSRTLGAVEHTVVVEPVFGGPNATARDGHCLGYNGRVTVSYSGDTDAVSLDLTNEVNAMFQRESLVDAVQAVDVYTQVVSQEIGGGVEPICEAYSDATPESSES